MGWTDVRDGLLIAAIVLGLWRAMALGANGVAAAGLMVSAAGLLITVCAFKRPVTLWALAIGTAIALPVGWAGQQYFADQPVDVTSQLVLRPLAGPSGDPAANQYTAALGVPKNLDHLELRLALVDAGPPAGSCTGSTYNVQRMGELRPTRAVGSEATADVPVPAGVRQLQLLITVNPAPACGDIAVYAESAVFVHQ